MQKAWINPQEHDGGFRGEFSLAASNPSHLLQRVTGDSAQLVGYFSISTVGLSWKGTILFNCNYVKHSHIKYDEQHKAVNRQ